MNVNNKLAGQKRFVLVHGIPSPYRLHLFAVLHRELRTRGWSLEVHFMKKCDGDRAHWNTDLDVSFAYRFWKNWRLPFRKGNFNPGLLKYINEQQPDIVMFGGVWDSLTCMIGIGLLRLPLKIGWYEANSMIPGRTDSLSRALKRYLLGRLNWHALPGQRAREFVRNLMPGNFDRLAIGCLPNLVDEKRFGAPPLTHDEKTGIRTGLGVPVDARLILTIARMIPAKGLIAYLREIASCRMDGVHFLIIGDGPFKEDLKNEIKTLRLGDRVTLKGFVSYEQMPRLYAAADVFCLPSIHDPNPLSVVEAMHTRLPLLLSNRVGNFPEALIEGRNGYGFDPRNVGEIADALRKVLALDETSLARMGAEAHERAQEMWASEAAIKWFLDPILNDWERQAIFD